jgi:hypothetical protein
MITSTTTYLAFFIAAVSVLWAEGQWPSYLPAMVANWFLLLLSIVFIIPVGILLGLHCFLASKGLTTYEFIVNKREKESKARPEQNTAHNCT